MQDFLTTEELIHRLKLQDTVVTAVDEVKKSLSRKEKVKKTFKTFFWVAVVLAILHTIYSIIPMVVEHRAIDLYGGNRILAIPNTQELDEELLGEVIYAKKFKFDDIEIGDRIVIYGKFGSDRYWVEQVVSIDESRREIDTTFGYYIQNTYNEAEVIATYVRKASLLGTVYYVASTPRGFVSLLAIQGIILTLIYYYYIRKQEDKK
jgi:hypothetical protein